MQPADRTEKNSTSRLPQVRRGRESVRYSNFMPREMHARDTHKPPRVSAGGVETIEGNFYEAKDGRKRSSGPDRPEGSAMECCRAPQCIGSRSRTALLLLIAPLFFFHASTSAILHSDTPRFSRFFFFLIFERRP